MFHYHAFGLRIESALALPELYGGEAGAADVRVTLTRGDVPAGEGWISVDADTVLLRLEDMAFTVSAGTLIEIVAPPERADNDIRIWLLGTVMATLLHQRGMFSLHANAVQQGLAAKLDESGNRNPSHDDRPKCDQEYPSRVQPTATDGVHVLCP